ncbi:MAG: radical SAM protein [Candidatus Omnitrophica bacterium]|nr:radical SAM protein [Candidatus Omnitrophota bacterium]
MQKFFLSRIFNKAGPPLHLVWFLTAKCNLGCSHCFYYPRNLENSNELSFQEAQKVILKLPSLLSISLTGGEPFLREDLFEITKLLSKKNVTKNIVLFSNGFNTEDILKITKKIVSSCLNTNIFIGISIDGFEEEHDKYRNKKGAYGRAISTLEGLKKLENNFSNLNVGIGITLHKGNQNIMKELRRDIYAKFKINPGITMIRGIPKSPELKNVDANIYKQIIDAIEYDRIHSKQKSLPHIFIGAREVLGQRLAYENFIKYSRSYDCYAGSLMGVIYENGDVYPCEMLPDYKLGNLRDYNYDISKLWKNILADKARKWIRNRKCFCTYECQYTCNTLYNIKFLPFFMKHILDI